MKPWLLMTPQEKDERRNLYLGCITSTSPIDEAYLTTLKPPGSQLQALFELFMYQLRKGN